MAKEDPAMKLVMEYEEKNGRNPKDVSNRRDTGCDIQCDDRLIEVKRRDVKYGFLFLTENEVQTFLKKPNACLYLVYYRDGHPKLRIFDRETVIRNLCMATVRYRFGLTKSSKENTKEIDL